MDNSLITIIYKTADGSEICVEVSAPVKDFLEQSDRQIRSQRRQDRRYVDYILRSRDFIPRSWCKPLTMLAPIPCFYWA